MFGKKDKHPNRIFIVEDNRMYAETLKMFLKTNFPGAEVEAFQVGEILLDNLDKKPDFILMDYYLNSKFFDAADGLAMISEIQKRGSKAKIIALSSQQDISIAVKIKEAGAYYVVKNDSAFESVKEIIVQNSH